MYKRQPNTAKCDPRPLKRVIFTIKCGSRCSDQLKLAIFSQKNSILNFFSKIHFWLVLAGFSDFGVNFRHPNSLQLTPPWSGHSSGTSQGIFRPLTQRWIGAPRRELQGKTWDFQKSQLWAQFSLGSWEPNWIPRYHVVYPPRSTPGTWNFWAISKEKRARAAEAKICRRPYLAWASR